MNHLLIVALGGAIGASLRYLAQIAAVRLFGHGFPWGTLAVNVVGSFAMGVFIELLARRFDASNELRLFVATGLLGGFTTFSAFSLDAAVLWERGVPALTFGYIAASVVLAIGGMFLGLSVTRSLI